MAQETVFITGGAGFLGINLVRALLERGYRVISYDLAPFDYPEKDRVTVEQGDIRAPRRLREALRGADAVVHCAAALPLYSKADIFSTDVEGTRNVLEAAREAGCGRVIHVSSTAVYGVPDHHPIREDDPLRGVGAYGQAKILAEEECRKFREQGMTVPILRPKTFIGPERLGVFALFYDWASDGRGFPLIGSGGNRYQLLDVEDLCEAILRCLTGEPERVNDTFNIGAKEFATMREDFQAVLDAAGFGKRIVPLPAKPVILTLKALEKLRLSPLYQWVYETAATDSFVATEKAERQLGFTPRYSNQEALIRNYRWYLANRENFRETTGISHRAPWKQGALRLFKLFF